MTISQQRSKPGKSILKSEYNILYDNGPLLWLRRNQVGRDLPVPGVQTSVLRGYDGGHRLQRPSFGR